MNKLFLLDAMALIYRAHFAFSKNPRMNSKGMNTGAVLGFTNTLLEVLRKEEPTHIGVAFDTAEPTFRHKEYKEYKAQREEQPEDITTAIPYIYKMVEAFNIPILVKPGYEADDIIGTVAKKAARTGEFEVYMMTPDKDYAQLVEDCVFLYKPAFLGNDVEVWDVKKVLKKFDIERVDQVVDLLGMQGDSVDNIPGIPGVGPKTAVKFLKAYGSLEGLLENTDQLKGKQKEKVEQNAEQARLSKKLARIDIEVPIEFDPEQLKNIPLNAEKVKALFEELEFRTLMRRVFQEDEVEKSASAKKKQKADPDQIGLFAPEKLEEIPETPAEVRPQQTLADTVHHYYLVDSPAMLDKLVKHLEQQDEFCFDTETTNIEALDAELVGIAFSTYPHEAYYVPIPQHDRENPAEEVKTVLEKLKPIFENPEIAKIAQNLKYDLTVLKNYKIELKGKFFDTMLAHYLIEPDMRHNMDILAENYLNYKPEDIENLIGKKGAKQGNMRDVPVEEVLEYAGEDADITLQLKHELEQHLKNPSLYRPGASQQKISATKPETEALEKVFWEIETPLIPVLAEMERAGVKVDPDNLSEISKGLGENILALQKDIYKQAGEEFNIDSPKQLGDILFDKLKLVDKPKKTKTGQYATGEEILSKLADKHAIISNVLEYRELVKLKNTYVDALPELIHPKTGRIHTSYNQAVAATGRLSSANPNLQNIPIRTEKGRAIRKAFVPTSEDYVLISADYSQIELRVMAAFSGDETMIEAFRNGRDIHATTASKIYKVDLEEVDSTMRAKAKTANFGIIYDISAFGLSQRLNIPRKEASEIIEAYFNEFPSIKKYMDKVIQEAREKEYVETIRGRRRYLRNINSRNNVERGRAERNAINAPIQGSAADMIKLAMINLHEFFQKEKLRSKMILQVHDELVFDAHRDEVEDLKPVIEDLMKNALPLDVPMEIEIGVGQNWLEAH